MNDQQLFGLLAACVVVLVPLGMLLRQVLAWLHRWLDRLLPPRYLRPVGKERRREGSP